MTKQELIYKVEVILTRENKDVNVKNVTEVLIDVIKSEVVAGGEVYLRGFGTFKPKHRKEKKGRDISRGKEVLIPAHSIPSFKPSDKFKIN